jgi:hypothetical protein
VVAAELAAFAKLLAEWCWGSWGAYDRRQIERECARQSVAVPLAGLAHRNLKAEFAKTRKIKQVGMAAALQVAEMSLCGEHHRALSDALNIACAAGQRKKLQMFGHGKAKLIPSRFIHGPRQHDWCGPFYLVDMVDMVVVRC